MEEEEEIDFEARAATYASPDYYALLETPKDGKGVLTVCTAPLRSAWDFFLSLSLLSLSHPL